MSRTSEWLESFNSDYQNQKKYQSKTISVTGGKGGVGKTSITLKFAKQLVDKGHKVLVIDCDSNLSNTALKLNIPLDNSFYQLISAEKSFSESLYKDGNFHLLSACNGSTELFNTNFKLDDVIIDILNSHRHEYDFIFLDCPAGIGRDMITLNAYCDHRIVVITPDKSSITDSYSLIKILNTEHGIKENSILINMIENKKQFQKVVKSISETAENFLNVRTNVLGGIKTLPVRGLDFDKSFLDSADNSFHVNFVKIVNKFSDQANESSVQINTNWHRVSEQEVQSPAQA